MRLPTAVAIYEAARGLRGEMELIMEVCN